MTVFLKAGQRPGEGDEAFVLIWCGRGTGQSPDTRHFMTAARHDLWFQMWHFKDWQTESRITNA
ncbi:hypothetical protein EMEDMD4_440080 [Sinorhizobium medicae]|uniref:Uncharacterized protein n=1 Tax=Sinorhizobium medicae TaxID=110321 RepID=A0A508WZI6_9HYPH|nr:hypothetical protein EMEDMD4_440080 [Sinorhizobium medicae]